MTLPVTRASAAPSVRSPHQWAIAVAQSLLGTALGLLLFLISFGSVLVEFDDQPPGGLVALFALDALVGVIATMAIGPLRFLRPGRLHSAAHLLLAAAVGLSVWSMPAAALALYRIGLRRRTVLDIGAVLLVAGTSMATLSIDGRLRGAEPELVVLSAVGVMVVLTLIPLLIGHVVGTRHELLASLQERAASAERERETAQRERAAAEREALAQVREREADAARVRAEERAALARDMHDSVSHHLATIALHAGAMTYREDLSPEVLRRSAGTVRDAAQQANRELRTVLIGLRSTDGDQPLASAPTLEAVVERCRKEGQEVELRWEGLTAEDLLACDRSTVVALARILTEVTVNAAKHAPGAPLQVTLLRSDQRVVLQARNPLPTAPVTSATSTGHGLLGVQERARLLGGEARYGAAAGIFEVEAWMPW
ncbi:sensor histidine kinase [uncultured Brachybacterium sp.]|uniref:sensor histidine kinase n=1 Tax=uncultured Brachybacterium sp. TaxID=189680 RepID=UPI0026334A86|nr:histidine kinase [uncultured Brachybacterium sp.]